MGLQPGVVAHLFYGHRFVLVDRALTEYVDPGTKDSPSETLEGNEHIVTGMERGLMEELGVIPKHLIPLGWTRAGHAFFIGSFTCAEFRSIRIDNKEVVGVGLYCYEELSDLKLGGSLRHHLAAYPKSFERLARGFAVWPKDFGLRPIDWQSYNERMVVLGR